EVVDAYLLAYTYVLWLPVLVTGLLTTALVPVIALSRQDGQDQARLFQGEVFGVMLLIAVLIGGAAPWILPAIVTHIPTAFSTKGDASLLYFLEWLSPIVMLGLLTVLGSTLLL